MASANGITKSLKATPDELHNIGEKPVNAPKLIVCPECARSRPAGEFPQIPIDPRCQRCIDETEENRIAEKRKESVERVAAELLDATGNRITDDAPTLNDVLVSLMQEFGGVRTFVHEWAEQIKVALAKYPGRASNLKHLSDIAKLIRMEDQGRIEQDAARMSDEQLQREYQLALMQILTESCDDKTRVAMIGMLAQKQGFDPGEFLPSVNDQPVIAEEDADAKQ